METEITYKAGTPYISIRGQMFTAKDLDSQFIVRSSKGDIHINGVGEEIIEGIYQHLLDVTSTWDSASDRTLSK